MGVGLVVGKVEVVVVLVELVVVVAAGDSGRGVRGVEGGVVIVLEGAVRGEEVAGVV